MLADAAVAANRRIAADIFLNPSNLWDVVLTIGGHWGAGLAFGMLVQPLGCLSSRWDVDRRYILTDAAVAANRRFAADIF